MAGSDLALRRRPVLWVAAALSAISLGLPWVGQVPGYFLNIRIFLVGAVALLVGAAVRAERDRRSDTLVTAAIGALAAALILRLSNIAPSALIVVGVVLALLVLVRTGRVAS